MNSSASSTAITPTGIVFVHPSAPPGVGGCETLLEQWIDYFNGAGQRVYVLHKGNSPVAPVRTTYHGATMIGTESISVERSLRLAKAWGADNARQMLSKELTSVFESIRDDGVEIKLIHVNNLHRPDLRPLADALAEASTSIGAKSVHLAHNVHPLVNSDDSRYMPNGYDSLAAASVAIRSAYAERGAWSEKTVPVICPGVDCNVFSPHGPHNPKIAERAGFKVFFPGRLAPAKGGPYMVRAAGFLRQWLETYTTTGDSSVLPEPVKGLRNLNNMAAQGFSLTFCSSRAETDRESETDREYWEYLLRLGEQVGVRDLMFCEDLAHYQMPAAYRATDVVVVGSQVPQHDKSGTPRTEEGICQVVLEAMASSRMVIVTDRGGQTEAVEQASSSLDPTLTADLAVADGTDPQCLAERIAIAWSDANIRHAWANAGRRTALSRYSLNASLHSMSTHVNAVSATFSGA